MARTKQTLHGDPANPPKNLLCGICGSGPKKGNKKMLETMKSCGVCKLLFPVHLKCARVFFKHYAKKNDAFDESKFISNKFKFFCNNCKTNKCPICDKDHPIGSTNTYIAVCSVGHWFICLEKCFPSSQCKHQAWVCALHQKQALPNEETSSKVSSNVTLPLVELTPTHSTLKSTVLDRNHVITKWFENKRAGSLSMLHNKSIPNDVVTKINQEFEDKMLSLAESFKDNQKLETLIDSEKQLNIAFSSQCNQIQDKNHSLLLDKTALPYSLTSGAIQRLKASGGIDAYLNEDLIYLFKIFLQENEILQKSPDVPHVYLPSCYEDILHPPVSDYSSTDFDKVIDPKWIEVEQNKEQFYQEYSSWFTTKSKGRLDIIFNYFKTQGKKPKSISMPYNKGKNHWITLRCVFPESLNECEEGYVYSIDYLNSTDNDKQTIAARLWFAKLMGVYFDILTKNQGYGGPNDIFLSYHEHLEQYMVNKEKYYSVINNLHLNTENLAVQEDNYNCGVITCLSCMKFQNKSSEWIVSQEEISELKCTLWRERFCSFLGVVTEELNKVSAVSLSKICNEQTSKSVPTVTQDTELVYSKSAMTPFPTRDTHLKSMLPTKTSTFTKPVPKKLDEVFNENQKPSSFSSNKAMTTHAVSLSAQSVVKQLSGDLKSSHTSVQNTSKDLKPSAQETKFNLSQMNVDSQPASVNKMPSSILSNKPIISHAVSLSAEALVKQLSGDLKIISQKKTENVSSSHTSVQNPSKDLKPNVQGTKPNLSEMDVDSKPASVNKKQLVTPVKSKKSNATYDEQSIKKFLHATTTKKERRVKFNAMNIEGNKTREGLSIIGKKRKSILTELAEILSERFISKESDTTSFFKSEMEKYETYYIFDSEYIDPSNYSNAQEKPFVERSRIMTVAIVEIADFGDWTYKHKSFVNNNEIALKREVTAYKAKNLAIIIRYIATNKNFEGHGYASYLLRWIAESYHGHALYVFTMMNDPQRAINESYPKDLVPSENAEKAMNYFKNRTFLGNSEKEQISLSIVNAENKTQKSITDENNILLRTTTSKLKNISQKYLYATAKFGKLDKWFVTKISYTKKVPVKELSAYLKSLVVIVYDHEVKDAWEDGVDYQKGQQDIKKRAKIDKGTAKKTKDKKNPTELEDNTQEKMQPSAQVTNEDEKKPESTQKDTNDSKKISTPKNPYKKDKKESIKEVKTSTPKNPYRKPEKDMTFYGLNPHFGWLEFENDLLSTVDTAIIDTVRNNPHKIVKIPGGHRDVVERKEVSVKNIDLLPRIKRAFHFSSRNKKEIGTCQWMAAIMLIDRLDDTEADKMMTFMKKHPKKVNWKPMFKGEDSLSHQLPLITKYCLRKVKKDTTNFIPFLMKANAGMYVCVLTDNNYAEKHVVGIDCGAIPKLIWDSSEKQALELTQQNLDRCTGKDNFCVKIQTVGEILPKRDLRGVKRLHPDSAFLK